jgi:uncharacterized membrane protein YfcA
MAVHEPTAPAASPRWLAAAVALLAAAQAAAGPVGHALVGVAAGAVRRLLPDGHRRRAGRHRRRHAVRAHRRRLLSLSTLISCAAPVCWWRWPARWPPGRCCCAAAWQPAPGLPLAVLASASPIGGAMLGLAMPANVVQILLGHRGRHRGADVRVQEVRVPARAQPDALSQSLAHERHLHRRCLGRRSIGRCTARPGLVLFLGIGVLAGMFGIGAGWANVPALNLLMGAPLKVSAGTSAWCCRWWIRRPPGSTSTRARCCR